MRPADRSPFGSGYVRTLRQLRLPCRNKDFWARCLLKQFQKVVRLEVNDRKNFGRREVWTTCLNALVFMLGFCWRPGFPEDVAVTINGSLPGHGPMPVRCHFKRSSTLAREPPPSVGCSQGSFSPSQLEPASLLPATVSRSGPGCEGPLWVQAV